jgi:hypothetical protein
MTMMIIIIIIIIGKRQKYADVKEELTRTWELNTNCIVLLVLSRAGFFPPETLATTVLTF